MNISMNEYFESFAMRTKVQGLSREDRFNNVLSRWRKTTEDSKLRLEREGGDYTYTFYETHRSFLEGLDKQESSVEKFAYLADARMQLEKTRAELFYSAEPEATGKVDASSFLIAEINEVLK